MPSRLATIDADLETRISALDEERLRRVATAAATYAVNATGIARPEVAEVLALGGAPAPAPTRAAVERLVADLDDSAWRLDEQGNQDAYLAEFSRARAANAVSELAAGVDVEHCLDTCYEAYAATGDIQAIRSVVAAQS